MSDNVMAQVEQVITAMDEPDDGKEACPDCGKRYVPGPGMGVHRHSAHGTGRSPKRRACPECGKIMGTKDMSRHRRDVHGVETRGRPPGSKSTPKTPDLTAEQITRTAAEMLWPHGVPLDKLEMLMYWNTQTALFLELAQR